MDANRDGKERKRPPVWLQTLDLMVRTWHIGVTGILFGGSVCLVPFAQLIMWHRLTIVSGMALVLSRVGQCRHWPYQVRGVMALAHVGVLAILPFYTELMVPVMIAALVLGVIAANMPEYIQHYSLIHRCRVE